MIDMKEFNQDIDDNWTASQILEEFAPHILKTLQEEFFDLRITEGDIRFDYDGTPYWVED